MTSPIKKYRVTRKPGWVCYILEASLEDVGEGLMQ